MKQCGASYDGWTVKSGQEQHTWPTGYMTWVIGLKTQTQTWDTAIENGMVFVIP